MHGRGRSRKERCSSSTAASASAPASRQEAGCMQQRKRGRQRIELGWSHVFACKFRGNRKKNKRQRLSTAAASANATAYLLPWPLFGCHSHDTRLSLAPPAVAAVPHALLPLHVCLFSHRLIGAASPEQACWWRRCVSHADDRREGQRRRLGRGVRTLSCGRRCCVRRRTRCHTWIWRMREWQQRQQRQRRRLFWSN